MILVTIVHPSSASAILTGPWDLVTENDTSSTWLAHRDEDGVRLQMRRSYRIVNTAGIPIQSLQIRRRRTHEVILNLDYPEPVITFGKPALRCAEDSHWQELEGLARDARLEIRVVIDQPDVDIADLPHIETRIKPKMWTHWPRISGR